ncbi:MAG: glycosyltransferase [Bacteroidota bacterium]
MSFIEPIRNSLIKKVNHSKGRLARAMGLSIKEVEIFVLSGLFDYEYYQRNNPDLHDAKIDYFLHFALHGAQEGRNPNRCFSTQHYVASSVYNDSELNPLTHFYKSQLLKGEKNGESAEQVTKIIASRANRFVCEAFDIKKSEIDEIVLSGLFDFKYYESAYSDVSAAAIDPILHYFCFGDIEGRIPSPNFKCSTYRQLNGLSDNELAIVHYHRSNKSNSTDNIKHSYVSDIHLTPSHSDSTNLFSNTIANNWVTPEGFSIRHQTGVIVTAQTADINQEPEWFDINNAKTVIIPFIAESELIKSISFNLTCKGNEGNNLIVKIYDSLIDRRLIEERVIELNDDQYSPLIVNLGKSAYDKKKRYYVELSTEKDQSTVKMSGHFFSDEHYYFLKSNISEITLQHSLPRKDFSQNLGQSAALIYLNDEDLEGLNNDLQWLLSDEIVPLKLQNFNKQSFAVLAKFSFVAVVHPSRFPLFEGFLTHADFPRHLSANGTTTLFIENSDDIPSLQKVAQETKRCLSCFHFGVLTSFSDDGDNRPGIHRWISHVSDKDIDFIPKSTLSLSEANSANQLPHVAIVTVLYKKAHLVEDFIRVVSRQSYIGKITLVLVDDCSPDDSKQVLEELLNNAQGKYGKSLDIKVLFNEENSGNCTSRNRGLNAVDADIYTIVDCDCLLNYDFISAHVRQHLIDPTDVVIGPLNLETNGRKGWEMLTELEENESGVKVEMNMQDDIQLDGFVNCITRNFSIKKAWLDKHQGFDPDFSYSAKKDSGFGWEDVEFGSRIYKSGAYVKFTFDAFSLHQSHPTSVPEHQQIIGSAKNFNRLFEKHPDIKLAARRWSTDTAGKIIHWAESKEVAHPYLQKLKRNFAKPKRDIDPFLNTWRTGTKPLRILQYRWHVPHQYEIHKLPHEFTLVTDAGTGFTNQWAYDQRPMRQNVKMLSSHQVKPEDYDLAIVHFDENVLCSDLSNGVLGPDWGKSFKWFMSELKGLPKVAICHGTPPFVGQYAANQQQIKHFEVYQEERLKLVEVLRDVEVVCNSYQSQLEWGFHKSRVIWHGLDPQEIPPGKPILDVVTHGVDAHRPHYRGAHGAKTILSKLDDFGLSWNTHAHQGPKMISSSEPGFASTAYRAWIDHLRLHKCYLNTTLRSPMPRSRSEAMIAGVIPVCINNHDVSCFIRNGVDGFYSNETDELVDFITYVTSNDAAREKISRASRMTAMDVFNHDRFLSEWSELLSQTTAG